MASQNPTLESIVKDAQDAFIAAKSDGKLEVSEVISIALQVAQKLQRYGGAVLSGSEKSALVRLTLQKGLRAAGGLPVLAGATPEIVASVEAQLLSAAAAAVDAAIAAAHGQFGAFRTSALRPLLSCLCSGVAAVKAVLPPSLVAAAGAASARLADRPEAALLQEAIALAGGSSSASNPVSATLAEPVLAEPAPAEAQPPAKDTSPATESQKEPSPQASAEESPVPAAAVVESVAIAATSVTSATAVTQ